MSASFRIELPYSSDRAESIRFIASVSVHVCDCTRTEVEGDGGVDTVTKIVL